MSPRSGQGERGQTANEYLMIAGLLTAMLIVLSSIIVPTMKLIGVRVVRHIPPVLFYRLFSIGMLLTGVKLLYDGLN